jgi:uncharacterized protein
MAHTRNRLIVSTIKELAKYWPVVGVLGLRQSGKSTVFREILGLPNLVTLDDEDVLEEVQVSAKNFLAKQSLPLVIDEAQKSPQLFDAIKFNVDRKRKPGSYFLTGSSEFSAKIGIRESLTGRIGLVKLFPFTLAEAHHLEIEEDRIQPLHRLKPRLTVEKALRQIGRGSLPVPLFAREERHQNSYYRLWLETSLVRDTARVYGRGYNPDLAWAILHKIGDTLKEGELPTLSHFKQPARTVRRYLDALSQVYILQRIPAHELATGKEVWLPSDCGLAAEIAGTKNGEGMQLSLGRVYVLNEIQAQSEYLGKPLHLSYYKTARSNPIDLIWNNVPIKISASKRTQFAYEERPLLGAMKKLGSKKGILSVPYEILASQKNGIQICSWTHWS